MPRLLTALVASAALATTSLPARAELTIDPGVVVGGLITLGLLGAVLSDPNNRDDHHSAPPPPPQPEVFKVRPLTQQPKQPQSYRGNEWHPHGPGNGHGSRQVKSGRTPLPNHCLRDVSRPGESMTLYGRHCLSQAQIKTRDLPEICAVEVPTSGGTYIGYSPSCLQARGYRVGLR